MTKPRLVIVVPGPPVPCARPRSVPLMRNGKPVIGQGGRPIIHTFVPDTTTEYENRVAIFARRALAANREWQAVALSDAPLRCHLHFVRSVRRGDLDNFQKAALDGLKKANDYREDPTDLVRGKPRKIFVAGVFEDDSRITQLLASMHTDPKDEPRTEIVVETANVVLEEPLWMRVAKERGWKQGEIVDAEQLWERLRRMTKEHPDLLDRLGEATGKLASALEKERTGT